MQGPTLLFLLCLPVLSRGQDTVVPIPSTEAPATIVPEVDGAPPPAPTLVQWCTSDDRCTENGDVGAVCSNTTLQCACSAHYTPLLHQGAWYFFGCYAEVRTALVSLTFPSAACPLGATVADDLETALFSAVASATTGTVQAASIVCAGDVVYAVLAVDVPSSAVDGLTQAAMQTSVQTSVASRADMLAVFGATTQLTYFVKAADAPPTEAPGGDNTNSPATKNSVAKECVLDNAALAMEIADGAACTALSCTMGYVANLTATYTSAYCIIRPSTFVEGCAVSGDCSFSPGMTRCVNGACVAPEGIVVKPTENLRAYTSVSRDWCIDDSDCRLHGDNSSECLKQDLQGSFCNCSENFAPPAPNDAVCMLPGTDLVPMAFTVTFADGDCTLFSRAVKTTLTIVIRRTLGVVTQLDDSCGSVTVFGMVDMNAQTLDDMATGTIDLLAELRVEALHFPDLLQLGSITNATVGNARECVAEHAVYTRLDHAGRCQVLKCDDVTNRTSVGGHYTCTIDATIFITEDDLTLQEQVAIALLAACVCVAIVSLLILLWIWWKHRKTKKREV